MLNHLPPVIAHFLSTVGFIIASEIITAFLESQPLPTPTQCLNCSLLYPVRTSSATFRVFNAVKASLYLVSTAFAEIVFKDKTAAQTIVSAVFLLIIHVSHFLYFKTTFIGINYVSNVW